MVIIPTEKRFDWQRAPVVLFGIVLLNIVLYFFYQTNDDQKVYEALEAYSEQDYLTLEWPVFKEYSLRPRSEEKTTVRPSDRREAFADFEQLYLDQDYDTLSMYLLQHQDFYRYLVSVEPQFSTNEQRYQWLNHRKKINEKIHTISYLNHGLTPSNSAFTTFISHQFLHGGLMHLMGNMFFLIICGFAVEAAIGHRLFLAFYLASGIAGGLLFTAFNWGEDTPLVGASGSISGVMAMYLALFRLKKIEFFYWIFIFVGYFRAPALFIFPFYIGKEITSFMTDTDSNVAFMAHTGGFILGGALVLALFWKKPQLVNQEYIEKNESIDPLQQQLAKVYSAIEKYNFSSALTQLNTIISNNNPRFEWNMLRVKLATIDGGAELLHAQTSLFKQKRPDLEETIQIEKIWRSTAKNTNAFDAGTRLKLGLSFCQLSNIDSAEAIFIQLSEEAFPPENLGVLARKLSLSFASQKNQNKAQYYEQHAERLIGAKH